MTSCTTCARLEVVLLPTAIEIRCKTTGRVILRLEMPEGGCQHWDGKEGNNEKR